MSYNDSGKKDKDKPRIVKRTWTEEEDAQLLDLVRIHGVHVWSRHGDAMEGRTGKQCRERYMNHLHGGIKKGDWTAEEDALIVEQQRILGNQWAVITKMLPGRSDNAVKNRWHAAQRQMAGPNNGPLRSRKVAQARTYTDPNAHMRSGGFRSHPLVPALSIPCLSPRSRGSANNSARSSGRRSGSRQFNSLNEAMMDMQLHEHSHGGHGHSHYVGTTGRSDYDPNDPTAHARAMLEAAQHTSMNLQMAEDGVLMEDGNLMEYAAALSPRGAGEHGGDSSGRHALSLDVPNNFFGEGSEMDGGDFSARAKQAASDQQDDPLAMSLNSLDSLFGRSSRVAYPDSARGGGPLSLGNSGSWGIVRGSREGGLNTDVNIEDYDEPLSLLSSRNNSTGSAGMNYNIEGPSPGMAAYIDPLLNSLSSRLSDPSSSFTLSDDEKDAPPLSAMQQPAALNSSSRSSSSSSIQVAEPGALGSPRGIATASFKPPQLRLDIPNVTVQRRTRGSAPPISFKDPSPKNAAGASVFTGAVPGAVAGAGAEGSSSSDINDLMLSKVILETLQHNTPRSPGNQQTKRTRRHSPRG